MSSPTIRVDDRELERAVGKLRSELEGSGATETATVAVRGILPGVVQRTPVRRGRLIGSWYVESVERGAGVASDLEYAGPVEYGVPGRFDARRMVRDTIAAEERTIVDAYEHELEKAGRRAGFDTR